MMTVLALQNNPFPSLSALLSLDRITFLTVLVGIALALVETLDFRDGGWDGGEDGGQ